MNAMIPKPRLRLALSKKHRRLGAVAAETALTLPILFIVVFASFEFARAHTLLHTADNAAYEGARRGIVPGAEAADCQTKSEAVLQSVGARDAVVTVTPSPITSKTKEVTVDVEIPMNTNGYVTGIFFRNKSIHGQCTLTREKFAREYTPSAP